MKTIKSYFSIIIVGIVCGLTACNDGFMQQIPETSLTVEGFFKSTADLQTYINGLYNDGNLYHKGWYEDAQSDNVTINTSDNDMFRWLLTDQRTVNNAGGWGGWGSLRSINVMLTNLQNVNGSEEDINHFVGIARYFRAWFYIGKIESYSDVPWIDRPLSTTDEQLYETQTPRAEVVQHVLEDLDFAARWIKADMNNKTRVHKYCALALLSRFALYEGTFRKYHPELQLASTANELLQKSVAASEELMNCGQFEITGYGATDLSGESLPGVTGALGFRSLFTVLDLAPNKEIIHWRQSDVDKTAIHRLNNSDGLMAPSSAYYSLSRSLQESFLTKDGKPYSTVAGYATKTFTEVFADRDPRFAETFAYPGIYDERDGDKLYHVTKPYRGGYDCSKYFPRDASRAMKWNRDNLGQMSGLPVYRLGEVLLNYAEAKAELGQLTDDVINRTVNVLRDRVGMPHFDPAREVDATLQSLYPNITDPALLAIRRERRVELAGEGFRLTDINRWYAGKVMELDISKQGVYVPALPYVYDVTNDGRPDFGLAASENQKTDADITWLYPGASGTDFYLENGTSGYIRNVDDQNRRFDEPKDYYRPIPINQIVLNPQLKQPYGW
jgi:hypothetical protein